MELETLLGTCSEVNKYVLRAELRRLMDLAQRGRLRYGRDGQVDQMEIAPTVLELRLTSRPDAPGKDQILRLYFTEPDHLPECLLALKFAGKHPGPMIRQEQNAHAKEAEYRADRCK